FQYCNAESLIDTGLQIHLALLHELDLAVSRNDPWEAHYILNFQFTSQARQFRVARATFAGNDETNGWMLGTYKRNAANNFGDTLPVSTWFGQKSHRPHDVIALPTPF